MLYYFFVCLCFCCSQIVGIAGVISMPPIISIVKFEKMSIVTKIFAPICVHPFCTWGNGQNL